MKGITYRTAATSQWQGLGARAETIALTALTGLAFLLVAVLALYNLNFYPRIWFDEGINLLAASTLAQSGHYGLVYSGDFHPFDLGLSTGPTVIVPISLVFRVFGIGIVTGRLVMAGYLILAAVGLHRVGQQLFGPGVGAVTVLTFATVVEAGPFANGRTVIGEIPALAYLFWGAAVFFWARQRQSPILHAGAGSLFGLAILTKNQFFLIAPVLALLWLIDRLQSRQFRFAHFAVLVIGVLAPVVLWYLYQFVVLGPNDFAAHLREVSVEASYSSYTTPLALFRENVKFLTSSGFLVTGAVGLAYVILLCVLQPEWRSSERLLLPAFTILWLAWYVVLSMGYPRYAAPAAITCGVFLAKLVWDAGERFTPIGHVFEGTLPQYRVEPLGLAVLALLALVILPGLARNTIHVALSRDNTPQLIATAVKRDVAPGAVIASTDWEVDFLSQRSSDPPSEQLTFIHPSEALIFAMVGKVYLHQRSKILDSYRVPDNASYLVDGPFSRLSGLYQPEIQSGDFVLVASIGEYDLYQRTGTR